MKRARIVFDLDGTLIDSAPDIQGIANALLSLEGKPEISLAQTRRFIGNGVEVFVQRLRELRRIPDDRQEPMTKAFIERYETAFELTHLYPHVFEVLQKLHAHHALGICTNKVVIPCRAVLRHLGIAHFFDTIVGGDSLPTRKPDPAMLHAAFENLEGGDCIYVGDSEVDAETALRANVPFLLFTGGYRKTSVDQIPARGTFSSHLDLLDLEKVMRKI
ncbi:MAG: HAD-IA family hydrolase [Roseobacter sp.]|jgi:phosphoglycolate phosphatase